MKLQSRFFITISLLIAFILAFITVSLIAVNKRLLADETDMRQKTALETTVGIVREAYLTRDTILMVNYLKLVKQDHTEIGWLCITDSAGKVQANLDMNLLGMKRSQIRLPESIRLHSRTVSSNAGTLGSVEVGFDINIVETHLQASMFKIKKRIAVAGLWALALGFIGSYLLALNLSGPIKALSAAAGEIGKGRSRLLATETQG